MIKCHTISEKVDQKSPSGYFCTLSTHFLGSGSGLQFIHCVAAFLSSYFLHHHNLCISHGIVCDSFPYFCIIRSAILDTYLQATKNCCLFCYSHMSVHQKSDKTEAQVLPCRNHQRVANEDWKDGVSMNF